MLLRVSAVSSTSNQSGTFNIALTLISGTLSNVSATFSGTNNFASGSVVSFSGLNVAALNVTGVTLGVSTTTGLGGTLQYVYDFGQDLSGPYNGRSGTVSKQIATETQTVVMIGEASYGIYFSHISFQSDTSFCGMTTGGDLVKYTLASDVATQNQTVEPGEGPTLFAVKSSNPLEFAYPGVGGANAVYIYNKKY
jgi:hypothetical protein